MPERTLYPPDLVNHVAGAFRGLEERNRPVDFPSERVLGEMLEVSFLASMLREEARGLEFRLGYCAPLLLQAASAPHRGYHWLPFDKPRPCSVGELRRLAPALDSSRSFICCHGTDNLTIQGIFTAQTDMEAMRTGSVLQGQSLPEIFNVSSSAPGELCANRGDACFVQLRNGQLRFPTHLRRDGPIWTQLLSADVELQENAWLSLHSDTRPSKRSFRVMTPYFPFLAHVLHTMEKGHHGGSLLIVPSNRIDLLLDEVIKIKYRFMDATAWTMCCGWVARLISGFGPVAQAKAAAAKELRSEVVSLADQYHHIMRFAENVGKLGGVDGAVVLTDRLAVVGFGAEITAHSQQVDHVTFHPDSKSPSRIERVDTNGTRHRSVIRFCSAIPGAIGFVLSQDGGIKVAKLGDTGVELWGDVVPSF